MKRVVVADPAWSYEILQANYMESRPFRLKPNVVLVQPDGTELFRINAHGFKGPDVDQGKRLVAVWGDSVIFGILRGWVEDLGARFRGFQFLNGGLEGAPLQDILEAARRANARLRLEKNIIFPGWHSLDDPAAAERMLGFAIDTLPGPVLATIPTSLGPSIVRHDLRPYFTDPANGAAARDRIPLGADLQTFVATQYFFWGSTTYSIQTAVDLLTKVQRMNDIIRSVASRRRVPLVDLYKRFFVDDLARFRDHFFDAGHLRLESYPIVQQVVAEELANVLR